MKKLCSLILAICMMISLGALTVSADNDPVAEVYTQNGISTHYTTVEAALLAAQSGDTVYLLSNASLLADATIKAGCIFVVPYSANDSGSTTGENNVTGAPVSGTAYATLSIADNVTLTVNGTLIVSGNQQSTQPKSGCLTGDFGKIDLSGSIVVKNGGALYARGEISGSGTVTAESGASVYQLFQILDWRGGTGALGAYNHSIFPFNRYELKNITANAIYDNGASLYGQYYIYANGSAQSGNIKIIGTSGLLRFVDSAATTDYIATSYASDTLNVAIHGAVQTGNISISIRFYFFNYTISSAGLILPFGWNMDVSVENGASLRVTDDMKFIPGCDIIVKNGATLTVDDGVGLYFYDADAYSNTFSFNGTWYPSADATLTVQTGATVNYNTVGTDTYGKLASSDSTGNNLNGITWPANPDTTTVYEYANNTTATGVTFYYA